MAVVAEEVVLPEIKNIDIDLIDPSPYQNRKSFNSSKLQELAKSIGRDGLIEPIVVRVKNKRFEIIAGERRWRAVSQYTEVPVILSRVVDVNDLQARRMCAAENMQREDLSAIEEIDAIVELVDAELIEDEEYRGFGGSAPERVKGLLGRLASVTDSRNAGYTVKELGEKTYNKFIISAETIFSSLPRPKEWRSFYNNDLPVITDIDPALRDWAIANKLNKSQTKEFSKLKKEAPEVFEKITQSVDDDGVISLDEETRYCYGVDQEAETLNDLSARDIKEIRESSSLEKNVHVSNNSGNNEWYTPAEYIKAARKVMGSIDTDPASCELANKTVQATTYYTDEDNGLSKKWKGNVWMNPPYSEELIGEFSSAIVNKFLSGEISQACVLVNNATETGWGQGMMIESSAICFIRSRVKFIDQQGNPSGAPLQGQMILYFGENTEKFISEFSFFGVVMRRS